MEKKLLRQISNYCVAQTILGTNCGVLNIDCDEIEKEFDVSLTPDDKEEIIDTIYELYGEVVVLDVELDENSISVNIFTNYMVNDDIMEEE